MIKTSLRRYKSITGNLKADSSKGTAIYSPAKKLGKKICLNEGFQVEEFKNVNSILKIDFFRKDSDFFQMQQARIHSSYDI